MIIFRFYICIYMFFWKFTTLQRICKEQHPSFWLLPLTQISFFTSFLTHVDFQAVKLNGFIEAVQPLNVNIMNSSFAPQVGGRY